MEMKNDKYDILDLAKSFADEFNTKLEDNLNKISFQFSTPYKSNDLDITRDEICKCFICNLPMAMVGLTNHLLESFIKYLLFVDEFRNDSKIDKNVTDEFKSEYGDKDLEITLNRAKRRGLITKSEWKILFDFKNKYRNSFSHSDKNKMFGDKSTLVQGVKLSNEKNIEIQDKKEIKISELIAGSELFKKQMYYEECFNYFKVLDEIIRDALSRMRNK